MNECRTVEGKPTVQHIKKVKQNRRTIYALRASHAFTL
ncbi:hypothetical protein SBDP1_850095 [Syntrophobacter sp. SbD1]|nr:hypothetical protein SBDP1_850095 [Syntrophobacter sp. SbD1]